MSKKTWGIPLRLCADVEASRNEDPKLLIRVITFQAISQICMARSLGYTDVYRVWQNKVAP